MKLGYADPPMSDPRAKAYNMGYRDGFEGRLKPYELGSSLAAFDWDAYAVGYRAGEVAAQNDPDNYEPPGFEDGFAENH